MTDYLRPVGTTFRIASLVGCVLASVICQLVSLVLWMNMIERHSFNYEGKPLWIGAVVVALVGVATSFIAWRLGPHVVAANGLTLLPIWFIQLFGIFFLVGISCVAYQKGSVVIMIDGVSTCLAMIFIGRRIQKRQRPLI